MNLFNLVEFATLRRTKGPYRSQRISLRVGPGMRDEVERISAFLREHDGDGHDLTAVHDGGEQTLVCSCGHPDLESMPLRSTGTVVM